MKAEEGEANDQGQMAPTENSWQDGEFKSSHIEITLNTPVKR